MTFNVRESFWGLNHLRLKICRQLMKQSPTAYLKRYADSDIAVTTSTDEQGNLMYCETCGFAMIKAEVETDWSMEMCSALPIVFIENPGFRTWLQELANKKLPSSRV